MQLCSTEFLAALLLLVGIVLHVPPGRARQGLLALCNAGFLATWIPNVASAVVLLAFVLSGWAVGSWLRGRAGKQGSGPAIAIYLAALLAAFVVLKRYQFIEPLLPAGGLFATLGIVGLSYILFRQIQFVVDAADGQIPAASLWTYLNFQLNLFTLLVGPIQRYQDFAGNWTLAGLVLEDRHALLRAYARVLIGMLKVAVAGALLLKLTERATATQLHASSPRDLLKFAILFYGYPAYIYFNFSGSCDVVIGGAALAGMRLPENFDRPFVARNVIDFWARWHITLTHWIRDYVFTPLYKNAVQRWPARAAGLSYACYFAALFLAGVWHGSTWNFVVFGLLHGAGVSVTKLWENRLIRARGRRGLREYLKSTPIKVGMIVLTLHFVCFTFLFFPPGLGERAAFLWRFVVPQHAAGGGT